MEHLPLADLIRMNRLIRGRIQTAQFDSWFADLTDEGRRALTLNLAEFAFQAGVHSYVVTRAKVIAAASADSQGAQLLIRTSEEPAGRSLRAFYKWLQSAEGEALHSAFAFAVALFGVAEGFVYEGEREDLCNHWWHRDLDNPEVESDILRDPKYFLTSMKTDRRITGRRLPRRPTSWLVWLRGLSTRHVRKPGA